MGKKKRICFAKHEPNKKTTFLLCKKPCFISASHSIKKNLVLKKPSQIKLQYYNIFWSEFT